MRHRPMIVVCILALLLVGVTAAAHAQDLAQVAGGPPGGVDSVLAVARDSSSTWISKLMPYAWAMFAAGAVIELVIALGRAKFSGELAPVVSTLVFFVLRKGFWAFVLGNVHVLMPSIVLSLQEAGVAASTHLGGGVTPQKIMNGVQELARVHSAGLSKYNPVRALEFLFSMMAIWASFGLCAALAWLAWFRAYIVMGAGCIMLGFAGTTWTEDYARRYFQYSISAGVQLLVIELLKGLFFDYLDSWILWAKQDEHWGFDTVGGMVGSAIALLVALISLPGFVAGIVQGSNSFAAEMGLAATVTKAAGSMASMVGAAGAKVDSAVLKAVDALKSMSAPAAGAAGNGSFAVEVLGGAAGSGSSGPAMTSGESSGHRFGPGDAGTAGSQQPGLLGGGGRDGGGGGGSGPSGSSGGGGRGAGRPQLLLPGQGEHAAGLYELLEGSDHGEDDDA